MHDASRLNRRSWVWPIGLACSLAACHPPTVPQSASPQPELASTPTELATPTPSPETDPVSEPTKPAAPTPQPALSWTVQVNDVEVVVQGPRLDALRQRLDDLLECVTDDPEDPETPIRVELAPFGPAQTPTGYTINYSCSDVQAWAILDPSARVWHEGLGASVLVATYEDHLVAVVVSDCCNQYDATIARFDDGSWTDLIQYHANTEECGGTRATLHEVYEVQLTINEGRLDALDLPVDGCSRNGWQSVDLSHELPPR